MGCPDRGQPSAIVRLAVLHTFSTGYFEHLAHTQPAHAGVWHLFGEVETVFGPLGVLVLVYGGRLRLERRSWEYLDSRHFVEPVFVFVIMVIAASRPVMQVASDAVARPPRCPRSAIRAALLPRALSLVPLLGSFITEPAAMTLAALMLREKIFSRGGFDPAQIRDPRRTVRERLGRRNTNALRRSAGADGGREVGVELCAHVCNDRLEGAACRPGQRAGLDDRFSARDRATPPFRSALVPASGYRGLLSR